MPAANTAAAEIDLGPMPEWNLADLYAGIDDPVLKRDLKLAEERCAAFETRFKGKLVEMAGAAGGGKQLAEAVVAYEGLEEQPGK